MSTMHGGEGWGQPVQSSAPGTRLARSHSCSTNTGASKGNAAGTACLCYEEMQGMGTRNGPAKLDVVQKGGGS